MLHVGFDVFALLNVAPWEQNIKINCVQKDQFTMVLVRCKQCYIKPKITCHIAPTVSMIIILFQSERRRREKFLQYNNIYQIFRNQISVKWTHQAHLFRKTAKKIISFGPFERTYFRKVRLCQFRTGVAQIHTCTSC